MPRREPYKAPLSQRGSWQQDYVALFFPSRGDISLLLRPLTPPRLERCEWMSRPRPSPPGMPPPLDTVAAAGAGASTTRAAATGPATTASSPCPCRFPQDGGRSELARRPPCRLVLSIHDELLYEVGERLSGGVRWVVGGWLGAGAGCVTQAAHRVPTPPPSTPTPPRKNGSSEGTLPCHDQGARECIANSVSRRMAGCRCGHAPQVSRSPVGSPPPVAHFSSPRGDPGKGGAPVFAHWRRKPTKVSVIVAVRFLLGHASSTASQCHELLSFVYRVYVCRRNKNN